MPVRDMPVGDMPVGAKHHFRNISKIGDRTPFSKHFQNRGQNTIFETFGNGVPGRLPLSGASGVDNREFYATRFGGDEVVE